MPGIEPGPLGFRQDGTPSLWLEDNRSTSAHRNWGDQPDSHPQGCPVQIGPVCYFPVSQLRESGACGENRTRTGDVLNVVPLLLGYASMVPRARIALALTGF